MSAGDITSFQQWSSNASFDAMAASNRDPLMAISSPFASIKRDDKPKINALQRIAVACRRRVVTPCVAMLPMMRAFGRLRMSRAQHARLVSDTGESNNGAASQGQ